MTRAPRLLRPKRCGVHYNIIAMYSAKCSILPGNNATNKTLIYIPQYSVSLAGDKINNNKDTKKIFYIRDFVLILDYFQLQNFGCYS